MFGNYGFSHRQKGQTLSEIKQGEALTAALDARDTRLTNKVVQSEFPNDNGTLGIENGDNHGDSSPTAATYAPPVLPSENQ